MSLFDFKTIAAIATPPGQGGIGVIRISGKDAVSAARLLLKADKETEFIPNRAVFQLLNNPQTGFIIDEAVVTYFKAPNSFTGEDVVEISSHGSPVVLAEILRVLRSTGVDLAQPGEFSMRAFLNQRMDLTQAEAINDLINSQTTFQARLAARQLRGELSRQLQPLKDGLTSLIVHFESTVEFVEDDLDPLDLKIFITRIEGFIETLSLMVESYKVGRIIRTGINLALIGRPNVGKSSIFNALLGRDRAIVTHLPGTTRDTLSEPFSINGIPVNLVDTAGIRETEDIIEQIGVERTRTAITEADFVIGVLDAGTADPVEDLRMFENYPMNLYVINKSDLGVSIRDEFIAALSGRHTVLEVSALKGTGIAQLNDEIYNQLIGARQSGSESAIITNERHCAALEEALASLRRAKQDLISGFTEEIALDNLHRALKSLGVVTGETLIADIINQIFSTFCIGK